MHKEDKLIPIITLVVYFGQKPWDGPLNLHAMLATQNEEILKFVPDYQINLIAPASMAEQEINLFKSDFRELAAFIKCGSDKEAMKILVEENDKYKHMDPLTANLANDVTKSNLKLIVNEKGEVDMCVAITGIKEESRAEGRLELLFDLVSEGLLSIQNAAKKANMTEEAFEKARKSYKLYLTNS